MSRTEEPKMSRKRSLTAMNGGWCQPRTQEVEDDAPQTTRSPSRHQRGNRGKRRASR
jgi:hypothetical protein